jgi:prolyl-tRNA synthetase
MLDVYREFAESTLAMPVVTGEKSEDERFPGAVTTLSIEAMMQDGKALQAGTSHYLGQSFAEAAEIDFLDSDGERQLVHTSSWGVSTRLLGALIMSHGDDVGLRLPPTVAPQQVVVIPVLRGKDDEAVRAEVEALAVELREQSFQGKPVRVLADFRDREAVAKRWEWTRKGVPLILEIGPRDLDQGVVAMRRRDDQDLGMESLPRGEIGPSVGSILDQVQAGYFERAAERLASRTAREIESLDEFREWFAGEGEDAAASGFVRAPWSEAAESASILEDLKVSVRCIPFDQQLAPGSSCILTGKPAVVEAVFGKAY